MISQLNFAFSSKEISLETREGKFAPVTYEIIIMKDEWNVTARKVNYDFSHFKSSGRKFCARGRKENFLSTDADMTRRYFC